VARAHGALLTVAVVGCVAATFIIVGVGLVPAVALGGVLEKSLSICALVTLGFAAA